MTPEEVKSLWSDGPLTFASKRTPILEHIDSQADEIKQANHRYADLQNICDDQYKEIKRLEDALVEERLSRNSKNRACLDGYGPEYDTEEFAREQLRAEGVIR